MYSQKRQESWKADLFSHQVEQEPSQDPAPGKATFTIAALYLHLWTAPYTTAPLSLLLYILLRCKAHQTQTILAMSLNLPHHIHSAIAAIMALWSCTFPSHSEDSCPNWKSVSSSPHFSPQAQSPEDIR